MMRTLTSMPRRAPRTAYTSWIPRVATACPATSASSTRTQRSAASRDGAITASTISLPAQAIPTGSSADASDSAPRATVSGAEARHTSPMVAAAVRRTRGDGAVGASSAAAVGEGSACGALIGGRLRALGLVRLVALADHARRHELARADPPEVAAWVDDRAEALPDRLGELLRARGDRALVGRVHVVDEDVVVRGHRDEARHRLLRLAHHDDRVAHLEDGVQDVAARAEDALVLDGAERVLEKIDDAPDALAEKKRRDVVVTVGGGSARHGGRSFLRRRCRWGGACPRAARSRTGATRGHAGAARRRGVRPRGRCRRGGCNACGRGSAGSPRAGASAAPGRRRRRGRGPRGAGARRAGRARRRRRGRAPRRAARACCAAGAAVARGAGGTPPRSRRGSASGPGSRARRGVRARRAPSRRAGPTRSARPGPSGPGPPGAVGPRPDGPGRAARPPP